jgi:hypothetical protein
MQNPFIMQIPGLARIFMAKQMPCFPIISIMARLPFVNKEVLFSRQKVVSPAAVLQQ